MRHVTIIRVRWEGDHRFCTCARVGAGATKKIVIVLLLWRGASRAVIETLYLSVSAWGSPIGGGISETIKSELICANLQKVLDTLQVLW